MTHPFVRNKKIKYHPKSVKMETDLCVTNTINLSEVSSNCNLPVKKIWPKLTFLTECALWPKALWDVHRTSRSWHFICLVRQNVTLCVKNRPIPTSHGKVICCVNCDPKIGNMILEFWLYVHYDLDLGDITLGQGYDTPLCYGQQWCDVSTESKLAVRSYGP